MNLAQVIGSLNDQQVKFVIIGATAAIAHGFNRTTRDIDIFIEPELNNIKKALSALQNVGYDLQGTTAEEALNKKLLFRQYLLELDLHPKVTGITFEQVWANKEKFVLAGVEVYFASLDDLIQMKEAANRPKDQQDLEFLRKIKENKAKLKN